MTPIPLMNLKFRWILHANQHCLEYPKPSAAQEMEVAWALIQEIGDLTSAQCERLIQILDREFPFPIYIPEKIGKRELT